jgi:glucokinase
MSEVYASVDLGGTKIACAFAAADGRVLGEDKVPTLSHEGPDAVVGRIGALVNELAARVGQAPAALGLGIPGLADLESGVTKFLPNLPTQWRGVAVREKLEPQTGCPVYLLNDVRMATLGELTFGHGRAVSTMVFFALGTGVGGGVVVDGRLRLGPMGAAGELGHQTIVPDGPLCGCGNRGCLETLASGPAIAAQGVWLMQCGRAPKLYDLVEGDASRVTPKEMAEAAANGDEAVRAALERVSEYIAIGVANMVVSLQPELAVLGGGVAEMGAPLFDAVRRAVRRRVGQLMAVEVRVEPSLLGDKAGMWGGVALAMRRGAVN